MDSFLTDVRERLLGGEELSLEDGCKLFEHPDLLSIGTIANEYRESLHGDTTYFNRNLHLNSTNVCEADCLFCSSHSFNDPSIASSSKVTSRMRTEFGSHHVANPWRFPF